MNIAEDVSFDNTGQIERYPWFRKLFLALVIILVALLSFGIGRLTSRSQEGKVSIEYDETIFTQASVPSASTNIENPQSVVTSKSGSKYHYPTCPGAKQISEKNRVIFASAAAAEAAGYTLAANCLTHP